MDTASVEKVAQPEEEAPKGTCRWCKNQFSKNGLKYFCSLDHQHLWRNKYRAQWQRGYYETVKRPKLKFYGITKCENCGKELDRGKRLRKFCNHACCMESTYRRKREAPKNENPSA